MKPFLYGLIVSGTTWFLLWFKEPIFDLGDWANFGLGHSEGAIVAIVFILGISLGIAWEAIENLQKRLDRLERDNN